jgi:hypothetical protein
MGTGRKNDAIGPNQFLNFDPANAADLRSQIIGHSAICHKLISSHKGDGTILGRREGETVQHEQNFLGGAIAHPRTAQGLFHGVVALALFGQGLGRDLL